MSNVRQFDFNTNSDVILHLRYAARKGGGLLRNGAAARLKISIEEATVAGSIRLFSIRHEFPSEWAKFKIVKIDGATKVAGLTLNFREEHYPIWSKGLLEALKRVDLFAKPTINTKQAITISNKLTDELIGTMKEDSMGKDTSFGGLRVGKITNIPLPAPTGTLTLFLNDNSIEDFWPGLTWGKGA
jgi:hypothetical protein